MSLLDPNGDLCLQVGESPVTSFVVCSKTLARTSDFWNKLLNGEFRESGKHRSQDIGSNWTVEFPEDDPRSMELLLNIIHGRFDKVPSYESVMDIQYLYNVSVLTDKYAMTHVLRPWAPGWLRRSMSFLGEWSGLSLREQYCHEWLWISWEFGDTANFEKVANFLLLNSCAWPEHPNNLRCDGVLEPPDIYEILEETRLATIEALLTPLNKIVRGLIRKDGGLCKLYDKKSKKKTYLGQCDCLASMLGTCIQSLYSVGLWPIPQPIDVRLSVSDLSERLKVVKIESHAGERHSCSQRSTLQAEVKSVLNSIPYLLTEAHNRHLDSQAIKSGVGPNTPDLISLMALSID